VFFHQKNLLKNPSCRSSRRCSRDAGARSEATGRRTASPSSRAQWLSAFALSLNRFLSCADPTLPTLHPYERWALGLATEKAERRTWFRWPFISQCVGSSLSCGGRERCRRRQKRETENLVSGQASITQG
jgi:hypothetical protein